MRKRIYPDGKKAVGRTAEQGDVIKLFLAEETIENFIDSSQFSKKKAVLCKKTDSGKEGTVRYLI